LGFTNAWRLTENGYLLELLKVDSDGTRKATIVLSLKLKDPMTEEEALKFVNSNYPKYGSSVSLAAERLGLKRS
jgi:hypothetical protein